MKRILLPIICLLAAALTPCSGETIVALYSNSRLRYFESASPGNITKTVVITGIPAGEALVAMDFRPTGECFVATRVGTNIRLYQVDTNSGAATVLNPIFTDYSGTSFGFDFIPPAVASVNQSAVIVSDFNKLQRVGPGGSINAVTMAYDNTTADGDPVDQHAGDNPAVTAIASTNNFLEAKSTVLYGIDTTPNALVIVNRVSGQLNTVGPLGAATGVRCGFDISGNTGTAYAALSSGESTSLYTVDLATGAAKEVGAIGGQLQQQGVTVADISVLAPTRLVNISTRSRVGTGQDAMFAGFTTQGGASSRLLIRGIGPSLAAFGVASPLPNPFLSIRNSNGQEIASNNNWKSSQQAAITATGLAPTHDLESAYLATFAPGAYTAILSDVNNATGVGVIEVYKLSDQ
jgi:hypothetical protein